MKSQGKEGARGGNKPTATQGPRAGRNARAGQASEGPRGGRAQGGEGARAHSGKNHDEYIKLAEGLDHGSVHKAHKKGLVNGLGGKQAASPANSGESDHETLRRGNMPKPQSVNNKPSLDMNTKKKALGFTQRSEAGNAEKGGGW